MNGPEPRLKTDDSATLNAGPMPVVSPDLLAGIIASASDIALQLDHSGIVRSVMVNPHQRWFGKIDHWIGQQVRDLMTEERVQKLDRRLMQLAETADVVERMCIETAVDLARNNRVAAARMPGLSRQSLYVKLRKYGLVSKDDSESGPCQVDAPPVAARGKCRVDGGYPRLSGRLAERSATREKR